MRYLYLPLPQTHLEGDLVGFDCIQEAMILLIGFITDADSLIHCWEER